MLLTSDCMFRIPAPPTWHVSVALGEHGVAEDGTRTLTPNCVTEKEVDYWVDTLIRELQELRTRAKQKLRAT